MEARLKKRFSNNIVRYVGKNTAWRIGRDENIIVDYQVTFGELYILIKEHPGPGLIIKQKMSLLSGLVYPN